nr:MAG TPA: hypothetical protein [Caudoviricetes sp.]
MKASLQFKNKQAHMKLVDATDDIGAEEFNEMFDTLVEEFVAGSTQIGFEDIAAFCYTIVNAKEVASRSFGISPLRNTPSGKKLAESIVFTYTSMSEDWTIVFDEEKPLGQRLYAESTADDAEQAEAFLGLCRNETLGLFGSCLVADNIGETPYMEAMLGSMVTTRLMRAAIEDKASLEGLI